MIINANFFEISLGFLSSLENNNVSLRFEAFASSLFMQKCSSQSIIIDYFELVLQSTIVENTLHLLLYERYVYSIGMLLFGFISHLFLGTIHNSFGALCILFFSSFHNITFWRNAILRQSKKLKNRNCSSFFVYPLLSLDNELLFTN